MKCLLVDDEKNLLDAFARQLENSFAIETCSSPEKALTIIEANPEIAVVVTDYKMPKMNGLELLQNIRVKAPGIIPIMLTGAADLKTVMSALNDGHVFRFLTKPCSPVELSKAISDGLNRFNFLKSEHELLEGTLSGCVKILTNILAIIDPLGYEQSQSMRSDVRALAKEVDILPTWEVELAAMLFELGSLVIPTPVIIKLRTSGILNSQEEKMWSRVPEVGANLIKQVPRLNGVAEIIRYSRANYDSKLFSDPNDIPKGSRLIKILKDIARLSENGMSKKEAVAELGSRIYKYDPEILGIVKAYYDKDLEEKKPAPKVIKIQLSDLIPGQKVVNDVITKDGVVLVKSGSLLDETLIERMRNYASFVGLQDLPSIEK